MLPKTLFGTGTAEAYLADTLNKLDNKRITARCMKMISGARAWSAKFYALHRAKTLSDRDVANLLRLLKAEQAAHFSALNKKLDDELAAWGPELTAEGMALKKLEALAFKLTMNIASASMKRASAYAKRLRMTQLKQERQLQHARREMRAVDLSKLKLSPEKETEVLHVIAVVLAEKES